MTITLNGVPTDVDASTVAGLLAGRDPRGLAVAVNGIVVPREQHAGHRLRAGDEVEIVTAVAGG